MLWSRESDVVADRQDDLFSLWRSTNLIDLERSKMPGLASHMDPQYEEILEREKLLQQLLTLLLLLLEHMLLHLQSSVAVSSRDIPFPKQWNLTIKNEEVDNTEYSCHDCVISIHERRFPAEVYSPLIG